MGGGGGGGGGDSKFGHQLAHVARPRGSLLQFVRVDEMERRVPIRLPLVFGPVVAMTQRCVGHAVGEGIAEVRRAHARLQDDEPEVEGSTIR